MSRTFLTMFIFLLLSFPLMLRADICSDPVETESGLVSGLAETESAACAWKGIPYAAPPVGELRWQAPKPAPAWQGVKAADTFGDRCMQKGTMSAVDLGSDADMSEDCLYLNVWRPNKPGKFPVMIWIHGGGYTGGSGSTDMYFGDRLAEAGEVVVVTINYRLNIFGFLAHPKLRAEDPNGSTGSYGSLDQVAAIDWVNQNIEAFGGDPQNVTIFGESAGGWSVCTMLASPLNNGKIHRAILESGGCVASASLDKGYQQSEKTAAAVGCSPDDLACLRAVPAEKLLEAGTGSQLEGFVWVPHHDDYLITGTPLSMIKNGNYNHIPFMAGSNKQETDVLVGIVPKIKYAPAKKYTELVRKYFRVSEEDAARLTGLYPLEDYQGRVKYAMGAQFTDAGLGCPTFSGMAHAAAQQEDVYYYRFEYAGMAMGRWLKAVHAMEIPFIFDSMDRKPISALYHRGNMEEAKALSRVIQGYWVNFAKSGDPNGQGLPDWPEYSAASPMVQVLDTAVRTEPADMEDKCKFWEGYNETYGPIFENLEHMLD